MMKIFIKNIFDLSFSIIFFLPFLIYSFIFRPTKQKSPKIVWGLFPHYNSANNSYALKLLGFSSKYYIDESYNIVDEKYFDKVLIPKGKNNGILILLKRYIRFFDIIKNFDVIITTFDGAFLRYTKLRFFEHIFWKIGKKIIIVWPYGSDTYIHSRMADHTFRYGLLKSYPFDFKKEEITKKQIKYFTNFADFIVGNIPHSESIPKWDIITVACYSIDTNIWKPNINYKYDSDGKNSKIKILHVTNHRDVKGTGFLINACNEIIKEGYDIELQIIEKTIKSNIISQLPHNELKEIMKSCDILAAQFLYGYAATEIEGMSLAKPVLSNLSNNYFFDIARRYTYFKNCPIISTPPEKIKENLIMLIKNPKLREDIGLRSRDYVIKYHSLEGMGLMWSKIVDKVYYNKTENLDNWWKDR